MSDHNSAAGLQSSLNVNPTSKNHRYIQNYICACWCFQGRMPASWLHFKFITGKSRKTNLYLAQIFLLFLYIVSKVKSSQVRTILSQLNASWLCLPYDSTNIFTLVVKVCKKEKNLITNVRRRKKCLTGSLQLTQKTVDCTRVGIFSLRVPESGQVGLDFSPQGFPLQMQARENHLHKRRQWWVHKQWTKTKSTSRGPFFVPR